MLAVAWQTLLLALPWIVLAVWLANAVDPYSHSRALREILAALLTSLGCVLACRSLGWRIGWLALLAWFGLLFLAFADAVSWFIQASSFNERFFAHFNSENFTTAISVMPVGTLLVIVGLVVCLAFAFAVLRLAVRAPRHLWWLLPALFFFYVGLRIDAPPRRLAQYYDHVEQVRREAAHAGDRIRALVERDPSDPESVQAQPGRNVVWIYLESIERSYLDDQRFPGLMPNVNRLRKQGLDFTGFRTFPGATYTISGLFSSQCGAPFLINSVFGTANVDTLHFVPGNDATGKATFHPELACFGDVLHAAGYDQTVLSGADLGFTDKRALFALHGYDHTLGSREIEALHDGDLPTEGWGLHDDDLYRQALATYKRKEQQDKPFSIVVETVDTHRPEGFVMPECRHYAAIDNPMLDAVHCADQLLGHFIDELSAEPQFADTVVVVMGDHIAMYNTASRLYPPDDQRQPFLMILNAGQGERPARMYHMDVAPTVLARMGVKSNVKFMAGADRGGSHATGTRLPDSALAVEVLRQDLWRRRPQLELCRDNRLIGWNGEGLEIDGTTIPVKYAGYRARSIADGRSLLVFVGKRTAHAQLMLRGSEGKWVARAGIQGRSVFKATPFWNDAGERRLALDWIAPGGAWASLGQVRSGGDIELRSRQCGAMLSALAKARPGQRLDFSKAFGLASVPAAREPAPGVVRMRALPAGSSSSINAAFMYDNIVQRQRAYGPIEINRGDRILMQPDNQKPVWADFDVSHVASLTLAPMINPLVGSCRTRDDTGIVGVTVSLDGTPVTPRFVVDRNPHQPLTIDTRGATRLRVSVDNGNGKMDCDWFSVAFPRLVTRPRTVPADSGPIAATR
ncbi:MAG TPA: sulfatase-like hydrolase/transferase [Rhodanobacteraceae bacterium]|nr:sulfatase-like hydrolase/transferase [Rhodanobacteraceae bacterium]